MVRMDWIKAWWRQLTGPPPADPWNEDPRIREERRGQHERINKVTSEVLRESMRQRWTDEQMESWRRGHDARH